MLVRKIKGRLNDYLLLKNSWAAWTVLTIGLVTTLSVWSVFKEDAFQRAKVKFDFLTGQTTTGIEKRLLAYEQILKGGVGLFNVKPDLNRKEFKTYVDNLDINKNFPGILGIGFAKYISRDEVDNLNRTVRNEGFPHFKVFPDYKRDIYFPIIYIEPFSGRNLRAFGYDMFTEEHRHNAMQYAMDNVVSVATEPVILVQETNIDVQTGFLLYIPVYKKNADISSVEKRRANIFGFVYSPFRMNDLMKGIMGSEPENIVIKIYDGKEYNDSTLMFKSGLQTVADNPAFSRIVFLHENTRTWAVIFKSTKLFDTEIYSMESFITLISGTIISLLLFISALAFGRNKQVSAELKSILDSTGEGIYGLDNDGLCSFINTAALEMIQYTREECSDANMHNLIHYKKENGESYPGDECPLMVSLHTAKKMSADDEVFWRKDGTGFPVEFSANPIIQDGETKGSVVAFKDISLRKKYEEKITNSLKEKEILLKEIHHRVKNNMQIISSLLSLQSQYLQDRDEHIKLAFQDSQNRIRSMALIHEKLYQSDDFSHVNFDDYIRELLDKLVETYRQKVGDISLDVIADGIVISMDTSISLGLILNELVTNCFKHAFANNSRGNKIGISLTRGEESYILVVYDNGKGFPNDLDFSNTESLGLQLVNTLVYQINGKISLENSKIGTKYIITFPLNS